MIGREMEPNERAEYDRVYAARIAHGMRATTEARATLKPGDRIGRRMCGGAKGTFTFTEWDGGWICGRTVDDCSPSHIYAVNGQFRPSAPGGFHGSYVPHLRSHR